MVGLSASRIIEYLDDARIKLKRARCDDFSARAVNKKLRNRTGASQRSGTDLGSAAPTDAKLVNDGAIIVANRSVLTVPLHAARSPKALVKRNVCDVLAVLR